MRGDFTKHGSEIWRDLVTPGDPARHEPIKSDIRVYLGEMEDYVVDLFDQIQLSSRNLVPNAHLLHWEQKPPALNYVDTAGGSAGFVGRELPNGRYGGPGGASGQYRYTRYAYDTTWPAAVTDKHRWYEGWKWLVGPDTPSYEYASAERATYIEMNEIHEPSAHMDRLHRVRMILACATGSMIVAPVLSVSCGTVGWLVGQAKATTSAALKYVTAPAAGSLYAYEATGAGTTGVAISGAANNGSGLIRLTVSSSANFTTGQTGVVVSQVLGVTAANGTWTITVVDSTHIDLQGSSFSGTYTSGGYIAKPPSHTTINAVVSDGGVSWKCLGLAKGRAYDIYEAGADSDEGTSYASTYAGTPVAGATFTVSTTPTLFECLIHLPPQLYTNTTDYAADPTDSSRTLLPMVDTRDYGGTEPYIGVCLDIIGYPPNNQELFIHYWEVIDVDVPASVERPSRRLQRVLSEDFEDLVADNLPASLDALADVSSAGLLAYQSGGTIASRTIAHTGAGLAWTNGNGAGNPTSALADDLAALEALSTTGFAKRTGSATWSLTATINAASELAGVTPQANGGMYSAGGFRGLTVANNSGTPNTQVDITATLAMVANSDGAIAVNASIGTLTCNISTAGSTANGRDQAGAFTNGSWVHFWVIYNGTTWASLASASATAPTLPSGYTHKAYAGAIYLESGGTLRKMQVKGNKVYYQGSNDGPALSGGTATAETSIALGAYVPANAIAYQAVGLIINANTGAPAALRLITVSGATGFANLYAGAKNTNDSYGSGAVWFPYLGSTLWYLNTQSSCTSYVNINAVELPIGQI